MQHFHDTTTLTLKRYYSEPHFIDWTTQPRSYKVYPHFYRRFNLTDYEELAFIQNMGKITFEKTYYNQTIALRTVPSAGGLYPCEIYIQIRGVENFLSGIYHYEPLSNTLVLLHELTYDGVEYYFNDQTLYQFTFLITCAYFRTAWKYSNRSIRYLLLDTGHQMGAIYAGLCLEKKEAEFECELDDKALNSILGLGDEEFLTGCIKVNTYKNKPLLPLREALPFVQPCDYFIKNAFIEAFFQKSVEVKEYEFPLYEGLKMLSQTQLQEAINNRRSIRAFKKESISYEAFLEICQDIFEVAKQNHIEIFMINNNIEGIKKGVYKNVTLQKEGEFSQKAGFLALNQTLAQTACATLFFTAPKTVSYTHTTKLCGFLAHMIYLKSSYFNIGCSGIGAYFDEEVQHFLETPNNILYLLVLGK
jgi:SagB-type dehydrogenase family enzyme